jgi:hypothetical protein
VDYIRNKWLAADNINGELNSHVCSYPCFLSSAVNVDLTRCFLKNDAANFPSTFPGNVEKYGLC